jgi:hypothetical protein
MLKCNVTSHQFTWSLLNRMLYCRCSSVLHHRTLLYTISVTNNRTSSPQSSSYPSSVPALHSLSAMMRVHVGLACWQTYRPFQDIMQPIMRSISQSYAGWLIVASHGQDAGTLDKGRSKTLGTDGQFSASRADLEPQSPLLIHPGTPESRLMTRETRRKG